MLFPDECTTASSIRFPLLVRTQNAKTPIYAVTAHLAGPTFLVLDTCRLPRGDIARHTTDSSLREASLPCCYSAVARVEMRMGIGFAIA
ncbi:hypothetical protein CBOM_07497 [Ceraceosorus bombacis]|uniref:Uncharacterized protein n=1 Tax=Ceraceosorus bombacis TaxID=401625 RepID=A0A0P1BDB1_9BASI|nr:hypothetical protein CBOM_07497 [Ceraceosorus bombacis]